VTKKQIRLCSGDSVKATLTLENDCVIRRYGPEAEPRVSLVLDALQKTDALKRSFVSTHHRPLEHCLVHEALPITYPHEWAPSMFKAAVLFYIDLLLELEPHGLILKDALPENILFRGTDPIFVDVFSLTVKKLLRAEEWLAGEEVNPELIAPLILRRMFVPYMLLPLCFYGMHEYAHGRELLRTNYCSNVQGLVTTWRDLVRFTQTRLRNAFSATTVLKATQRKVLWYRLRRSVEKANLPWQQRLEGLRKLVDGMNVSGATSGYIDYYAAKQEDYDLGDASRWLPKQRSVNEVMRLVAPTSVLDIGANTGWFARLACEKGASVVACDVDVACVEKLYALAVQQKLRLTPLLLGFDDLSTVAYSLDHHAEINAVPFYLPATQRLESDLVLVLGLLHHLTLGEGKSFDEVLAIVRKLTVKTAVIEYVSLDDALIKANPAFFRNLSNWTLQAYSIDVLREKALKVFGKVTIRPSHPATRSLVVCDV